MRRIASSILRKLISRCVYHAVMAPSPEDRVYWCKVGRVLERVWIRVEPGSLGRN